MCSSRACRCRTDTQLRFKQCAATTKTNYARSLNEPQAGRAALLGLCLQFSVLYSTYLSIYLPTLFCFVCSHCRSRNWKSRQTEWIECAHIWKTQMIKNSLRKLAKRAQSEKNKTRWLFLRVLSGNCLENVIEMCSRSLSSPVLRQDAFVLHGYCITLYYIGLRAL